jgi:hypothetical protein
VTIHANLYYLFLEDREANPIRTDKNNVIRKNVENFYKELTLHRKIKTFFLLEDSNKNN